MIDRADILSIEYLKKTEYTGCHKGMRYRLEAAAADEAGGKALRCTVWPEPFCFAATPDEEKESAAFSFDEDGITDAVAWMNGRLYTGREKWDRAGEHWDRCQ